MEETIIRRSAALVVVLLLLLSGIAWNAGARAGEQQLCDVAEKGNLNAASASLEQAVLLELSATQGRPSLIIVHSHIGHGARHKHDSPTAHGEPLGPEEVRLTKEFFGFSPDQMFVVPPARVRVEEASPIGWDRYAGPHGIVVGMRTFGMFAPMKIVAEHFGFTAEHFVAAAKETLARSR